MLASRTQNENQILAAFEDAGFRITEPRREIASALSQQPGTFSAADINAIIPALGRATVYRTLKVLMETEGMAAEAALAF